mgnify:CR=1 FL=1
MRPNVDAIIITFEPERQLVKTLKNLNTQVRKIYIVDNSANNYYSKIINDISKKFKNVESIFNSSNLGIAKAQNIGIKTALFNKADWCLLLDQDSIPEKNMINNLLKSAKLKNNKNRYFYVAPIILDKQTSRESRYFIRNGFKPINNKINSYELDRVIASGSLINQEVFRKIGLMRSEFFIDYVDFEFCLRATSNNYKIKLEKDALLIHEQGKKSIHKIGPFKIMTHNYSSLRRYYIFRNRVYFIRLYSKVYPKIILHEILACCFDIFRIFCFENNKMDKFKKVCIAILDGLTTKIPSYEEI